MRFSIGLLVGLIFLAAGPAAADPRCYVNGTGDQLLQCGVGPGGVLVSPNQGGVCFEAGHIQPGFGQAQIWIQDDFLSPSSGFYCQDKTFDGICDEDSASVFCANHTLTVGGNWDPAFAVWVFVDGPVFGNPVLSACGTASFSFSGCVFHSP